MFLRVIPELRDVQLKHVFFSLIPEEEEFLYGFRIKVEGTKIHYILASRENYYKVFMNTAESDLISLNQQITPDFINIYKFKFIAHTNKKNLIVMTKITEYMYNDALITLITEEVINKYSSKN